MSLEKAYRDLQEAAASRTQDQKAEVPVNGSTEETAEQKAKPGDTHANRKADAKASLDAVGEKPKEESNGVGSEDMMDPSCTSEPGTECPSGEVGHGMEMDITKTKLESEEATEEEVVAEAKEEKDSKEDEDEMEESSCGSMKKESYKKKMAETSCDSMKKENYKKKMAESAEFSLSDELGSLLEAEGLEEGFKTKAVSIFEAAVNEAATQHLAKLDEEAAVILSEEIEAHKAVLDEQVEKYLDYVVQEWVKENQVALQSQVRNQVAESFMEGLKGLLEEHYVELPEGKEDMFEAQVAVSKELETELAEQVEKSIELQTQLEEAHKTLEIEKFVSNLTTVEAEKIRSLAESVEFEGLETFQAKLGMLKENYFPEQNAGDADMIVEDAEGDASVDSVDGLVGGSMSKYLSTLSRMKPGK